jgi:hypothetical protein
MVDMIFIVYPVIQKSIKTGNLMGFPMKSPNCQGHYNGSTIIRIQTGALTEETLDTGHGKIQLWHYTFC